MVSKALLLFLGVLLVAQASKIPEGPPCPSEKAVISSDLPVASSDEIDDEIPSDVKFSIAKLVRELLDKLRGILEKLLDFAESQFRVALGKANGMIKKLEDLAHSKIGAITQTLEEKVRKIIEQAAEKNVDISDCARPKEKKFEKSLGQLLQEFDGEITKALDEETVKMHDSLDQIKNTITEIDIEPCPGNPLAEFSCWTKELTRVTKALLYIPTEISKQTAQTLVDIGSLSMTLVSTAQNTIKRAESIEKEILDDLMKCIPPVK